jgi:glycosyltransferase involved in cell wall biosynthesis
VVCPICRDPYLRAWRGLEAWEEANLAASDPAAGRGARWPLAARVRGTLKRLFLSRRSGIGISPSGAFLEPEIFSSAVASALPEIFSAIAGPRAAIFHDAVALTHPELTPPRTVSRFPAYMHELAVFDGIAAVSESSRDSLADYWRWLGLRNPPPVVAIPLGVDAPRTLPMRPPQDVPVVLSVGTIEGRKNHVALLEACERLWARGIRFRLLLIGRPQAQTGGAALRRIGELQKAGRAVFHLVGADDTAREEAYFGSTFTVFPSLAEGFGIPVAESLAYGLPCICSGRGASGEMARGGGCLTVDVADPAALAAAIERLLSDSAGRDALADEARRRPVRTWTDYSRDVSAWMGGLPRRDNRAHLAGTIRLLHDYHPSMKRGPSHQ